MTAARIRLAQLRLALMFLTRLPVGTLAEPVPTLLDARWAFPVVGLVVGFCGWLAQTFALSLGFEPTVSALAAWGAMALMTGALHLDGLADFADGIGGGRDKEHCLEIMHDSRLGSYGAIALMFCLACAVAGLATFDGGVPLIAFLLIATSSRLAMLLALEWLPPARADGLGHGSAGTSPWAWAPGTIVTAVLVVWIGLNAFLVIAAIALVTGLIAWRAMLRIGGQTGDVLGTVQVVSETTAILGLAVLLN